VRRFTRTLPGWVGVLAGVVGLFALAVLGIDAVLALWPTDSADVLGARIDVGAQRPSLDAVWRGPGQLESFGQTVDVRAVDVVGPVRPFLGMALGPYDLIRIAGDQHSREAAGSLLQQAFVHWVLLRTPAVLVAGLLLTAAASGLLSLLGVVPGISRTSRRAYLVWTLASTLMILAVWAGCLGLAAVGSRSLFRVTSLADVFDYQVLRTAPGREGVPRSGYQVVVLGDSRVATYGGKPVPDGTREDEACHRSRDSLAAQMQQQLAGIDWKALNLACFAATLQDGVLKPQRIGGITVPSQVGQLKNVDGPRVVVLAVGPNDVYWAPLIGSCYLLACDVSGLGPTVDKAMSDFSRGYEDLLAEIGDLPGKPQVIVLGSYAPFAPDATCADTRQPGGNGRVTPSEVATVTRWRDRLDDVLRRGADRHGFGYLQPQLTPLCEADPTGVGPDVQPLSSPFRFHPTAVGVLKMALAAVGAIDPERLAEPPPSPSPSQVGGGSENSGPG